MGCTFRRPRICDTMLFVAISLITVLRSKNQILYIFYYQFFFFFCVQVNWGSLSYFIQLACLLSNCLHVSLQQCWLSCLRALLCTTAKMEEMSFSHGSHNWALVMNDNFYRSSCDEKRMILWLCNAICAQAYRLCG